MSRRTCAHPGGRGGGPGGGGGSPLQRQCIAGDVSHEAWYASAPSKIWLVVEVAEVLIAGPAPHPNAVAVVRIMAVWVKGGTFTGTGGACPGSIPSARCAAVEKRTGVYQI